MREAASLAAVSVRTIERAVEDGALAVVEVTADAPRIRVRDLEAYLDSRRVTRLPDRATQVTAALRMSRTAKRRRSAGARPGAPVRGRGRPLGQG